MEETFDKGIAFINGDYVPIGEARIPLLDWGFLRSDANQDTVSVWNGVFFRLDDHLERFSRNIARLRMTGDYDAAARRDILFQCVRKTGFRNAYVQMIMTRGQPPVGVRDPRRCANQLYVFCVPYIWVATPERQKVGLHLHVSGTRRVPPESVDPTIKHFHWLDFEMGLFEAYDAGADTVLLTDSDGNATEGPGFNLFAVKDGVLTTPDRGVLDGMTRRTVFELCDETNLACRAHALPVAALRTADEVFLSTTAGGLIPITVIDGMQVGDGAPGPVTKRLADLYWSKRAAGWHGTPAVYDDDGEA